MPAVCARRRSKRSKTHFELSSKGQQDVAVAGLEDSIYKRLPADRERFDGEKPGKGVSFFVGRLKHTKEICNLQVRAMIWGKIGSKLPPKRRSRSDQVNGVP